MLKTANQLLYADRLSEAIALYDAFIDTNPDQTSLIAALYNKAQAQDQSSQFAAAAATYQKIININPTFKDSQIYYEQGQLYQSARMPTECIQSYRTFLIKYPQHAQCNFNLGKALQTQGQLQESLKCFERAYQAKPTYIKAYKAKIALLKKQNQFQQIATTCALGLKYEPTDVQLTYEQGYACYKLGRYKQAQSAFQQAIKVNRKFVRGYISLGQVYYKLENDHQGLAILQRCLSENKDVMKTNEQKQIYICMGVIRMNLKQYKEAIQCFQLVLSQPPPIQHVKIKLAVCLEELGNTYFKKKTYSDALQCYTEALKYDPNRSSLINNTGLAYQNINNLQEAEKCFRKVLQQEPANTIALNNLAALQHSRGNQQQAKQLFDRLTSADPDSYEAHINNGKRFMALKKYEQAINQFKKAEQTPQSSTNFYLFNDLAVALQEVGQYEPALKYADTANKLSDNKSPLMLLNRASILMHLKRIPQAKQDLDRAAAEIRNPDKTNLVKFGINAENLKFIFNQIDHYAYLMSPINVFREGLEQQVKNCEGLQKEQVYNNIVDNVVRAEMYAISQVMSEIKKEKEHPDPQINPEKARTDRSTVQKWIDDATALMKEQIQQQNTKIANMKMEMSIVKKQSKQLKEKLKYLPQSCHLRQTLQELYDKKDLAIWQYGKQLYWILNGYLSGYMLVSAGVVGKGEKINRSVFSQALSTISTMLQFAKEIPIIGNFSELISKICGVFVDIEDEVIIKKMYELISFNYDTQEDLNDAICSTVVLFLNNPEKVQKVRNKLVFSPPEGFLEKVQETLQSVGKWFQEKKNEFVTHMRGFQKAENILQSELAVIDVGLIISIMLTTKSDSLTKIAVITNAAHTALAGNKLEEMVCESYKRENENLRVSNNSFCLVMRVEVQYDNPLLNCPVFLKMASQRGKVVMDKVMNFKNNMRRERILRMLQDKEYDNIIEQLF